MKRYIIIKGGIGNQMFQYAFYRALKQKGHRVFLDTTLYKMLNMHNGYELSKVFGVSDRTFSRPWLFQRFYDTIEHFIKGSVTTYDNFCPDFDFSKSKKFLNGYWQSEAYFESVKNEIIKQYTFLNIDEENLKIAKDMNNSNSVSIHIRRGDYLGLSMYANVCTEDYYRKSVEYILEHENNVVFYIFSNDTSWSKNFAEELGINYIIISQNTGADSYKDMYLMTQCRHNIIANSSFSWWGAYLNQNESAIKIAPRGWDNTDSPEFNKMRIPETYIRL